MGGCEEGGTAGEKGQVPMLVSLNCSCRFRVLQSYEGKHIVHDQHG